MDIMEKEYQRATLRDLIRFFTQGCEIDTKLLNSTFVRFNDNCEEVIKIISDQFDLKAPDYNVIDNSVSYVNETIKRYRLSGDHNQFYLADILEEIVKTSFKLKNN